MPSVEIGFEQLLAKELAINRSDIIDHGMGVPQVVAGAMAVRPGKVLEWLKISEDELLGLLRSGELVRPGKWGGGRVAWRWDEIDAVASRLDLMR